MSTVSLMTSLLKGDRSRFLPPQHKTLDHRLFEDVSVESCYLTEMDDLLIAVVPIGLYGLGIEKLLSSPNFPQVYRSRYVMKYFTLKY